VPEDKKSEEQPKDESKETPTDEQPKADSEQEKPADEQPKDESKKDSDKEDSDKEDSEKEDSDKEDAEGEDDGKEEDSEELDLPRAKDKIAKANAEAKNLRNRLRDAEEKLKNAKSTEEVDEIVKQLQTDRETAEADLLRENVALKFKLPEKAQKRLAGTTREELEADAKELADLFGSEDDEDINLEGGLSPRGRGDEASDPRSLAKKHGARRRR
jgi:hypothetical protein